MRRAQPCLPYKQMKKVLKKADEINFFTLLRGSLRELEVSFNLALADVINSIDECLVSEACKLASWVRLNSTAARKIVKKHDKQHRSNDGANWFAREWGKSTLFGKSSSLLADLLLCLSLRDAEHSGARDREDGGVFDPQMREALQSVMQGSPEPSDSRSSLDIDTLYSAVLPSDGASASRGGSGGSCGCGGLHSPGGGGVTLTAVDTMDFDGFLAEMPLPPIVDEQQSARQLADRLEAVLAGVQQRARAPGPSVAFPLPCVLTAFDMPPLPPPA